MIRKDHSTVESEMILECEIMNWGQNRNRETLPPIESKAGRRAASGLGILDLRICLGTCGWGSHIDKISPLPVISSSSIPESIFIGLQRFQGQFRPGGRLNIGVPRNWSILQLNQLNY